MTPDRLAEMLTQVQQGVLPVEQALERLKHLPFEDLGFARIDHHRTLRKGFSEVIWGPGKTSQQIAAIASRLVENGQPALITRLDENKAREIKISLPALVYYPEARIGALGEQPAPKTQSSILVVAAGTADIPVAEEAVAEWLGNTVGVYRCRPACTACLISRSVAEWKARCRCYWWAG